MKKAVFVVLLFLFLSAGCGNQTAAQGQTSQKTAMGNPWSDWASIVEAETAAGFSFDLPEVIADRYTAVVFRTLNNELLEIVYGGMDCEICVRKQKGEGQDISGDYNQYDVCEEEHIDGGTVFYYYNSDSNAEKQIISYQGFSWSIVASDGYGDGSHGDFVREILGQSFP